MLKNKNGNKNKKKSQLNYSKKDKAIRRSVIKNILAVFLIVFALLLILSLFGLGGILGETIEWYFLSLPFGIGRWIAPVLMIFLAVMYFRKTNLIRYLVASAGSLIFFFSLLATFHLLFVPENEVVLFAHQGRGGGFVGLFFAKPILRYMDKISGLLLLLALNLTGLMLFLNLPLGDLLFNLKLKKQEEVENDFVQDPKIIKNEKNDKSFEMDDSNKNESEIDDLKMVEQDDEEEYLGDNIKAIFVEESEEDDDFKEKEEKVDNSYDKKVKNKKNNNNYKELNWKKPPIDIFEENKPRPQQSNIKQNIKIIKDTLKNFNIKVREDRFSVGPTVTQYTFRPAVGVKVSRIVALQNDLALALAADSVRIQAPIPGKALIGIEVPNNEKSFVRLKSMLKSDDFLIKKSPLTLCLGEDVNGNPMIANIEKMPHLLVAGSTNTGKSVCINSIISTLIYQNSPEDLNLILVDPKRVELSVYNGIPHLLSSVIVDPGKVVNSLRWAVKEMERRYKLLEEVGSRNIASYNDKLERELLEGGEKKMEKMPFIVIIVDEMAELMATHGKDIEKYIARLAQMARAVGIHLIVSTQRPTTDVITGLIKANINVRIAFQVASQIDSRTILDCNGAEKLLGNGDLLYLSTESSQPRRVQGVFVSEEEVSRLVDFVKNQAKELIFDEKEELAESLDEELEVKLESVTGFDEEGVEDDELYEEARELVIVSGKASSSMLQRRLKIGYSRAARIVDMLEEKGVVGPAEGSKSRKVLISSEAL